MGRFTSPHLHSYRERIAINSELITEQEFLSCLAETETAVKKILRKGNDRPTEFEILTAAALMFFARKKVDIVVLEVGMGGRYDSTNVVDPEIAVITKVAIDHTEYLGNTLSEIAYEKAGIIKPGIEVVAGTMESEALEVIEKEAKRKSAVLYKAGDKVVVKATGVASLDGQLVEVRSPQLDLGEVFFSLPGDYQLENLKTAMMVLSRLAARGWRCQADAVRRALGELYWPGRLEKVSDDPLVILDAAHNPDGAAALARALEALLPGRSRILVCGLLDDKDALAYLHHLSSQTRLCVVTKPESARATRWREKAEIASRLFYQVVVEEDIQEAVCAALRQLRDEEYVLITGSFYLLDKARSFSRRYGSCG